MQNKTISFETAEAAVMQTWKSLLKQTNPYLVPILLPMIEHFKPLFQEFYDLGVSHGSTAQAVPEGFILIPKKMPDEVNDHLWDFMTDNFVCTNDYGDSFMACDDFDLEKFYAELVKAQEQANE